MQEYLTLYQLNSFLQQEIKSVFSDSLWVLAETSDVKSNNNGHCYLEFIEKNEKTNAIMARARGYIWANTFEILKPYFEEKTGQTFTSGIRILINVSVDFHPVYGFGLNVLDIDPTYTLGDLKAKRDKILQQLEAEGIIHLNKELSLPLLPQRIAVISSPTAAGYEDFRKHLENNSYGFVFYHRLFPAIMQGEQTEISIIAALDKIYQHQDLFDVVVIIRGGGATSDLASFDSYPLAVNCAQFPLPIITGIGHERDDTVLDFISFHRAKTPTATADFLVETIGKFAVEMDSRQECIMNGARKVLDVSQQNLRNIKSGLTLSANRMIIGSKSVLEMQSLRLRNEVKHFLLNQETILKSKQTVFELSSPEYILAKGYSITLKNGKSVKSTTELQEGDEIETVLYDGKFVSKLMKQSDFIEIPKNKKRDNDPNF